MNAVLLRNEKDDGKEEKIHVHRLDNHPRVIDMRNQIKRSQYAVDALFLNVEKKKIGLKAARLRGNKAHLNKIPFSQFSKLEEMKKKQKVWEKKMENEKFLTTGGGSSIYELSLSKRYPLQAFEEGYTDVKSIEEFNYLIKGKRKPIHVKNRHTRRMKDYHDQLYTLINTPRGTIKKAIGEIVSKRTKEEIIKNEKNDREKRIAREIEFNEKIETTIKRCKGIIIAFAFLKNLYNMYSLEEKIQKRKEFVKERRKLFEKQNSEMGAFFVNNLDTLLRRLDKEENDELKDKLVL